MKKVDTILQVIEKAFSSRQYPEVLCFPDKLSEDEYKEVKNFNSLRWQEIDKTLLQKNYSVIFLFSPEAFCYYLPAIMSISIKEKNGYDLIIVDSLISQLDRSPIPDYWDNFLIDRWSLLKKEEFKAVQSWLIWLSEDDEMSANDLHSLDRAFDTVELLKDINQ